MSKNKILSGFLWGFQTLLLINLGTMIRAIAKFYELPFIIIMGLSIVFVAVIPEIRNSLKEKTP